MFKLQWHWITISKWNMFKYIKFEQTKLIAKKWNKFKSQWNNKMNIVAFGTDATMSATVVFI